MLLWHTLMYAVVKIVLIVGQNKIFFQFWFFLMFYSYRLLAELRLRDNPRLGEWRRDGELVRLGKRLCVRTAEDAVELLQRLLKFYF